MLKNFRVCLQKFSIKCSNLQKFSTHRILIRHVMSSAYEKLIFFLSLTYTVYKIFSFGYRISWYTRKIYFVLLSSFSSINITLTRYLAFWLFAEISLNRDYFNQKEQFVFRIFHSSHDKNLQMGFP